MKRASLAAPGTWFALIRALGLIALALLGGTLLWRLGIFLTRVFWAVGYPNELDYGEGIVWQQMRMLVAGEAYGPIDGFPSIVFHYPPLYHALTWALAQLGGLDQLIAGRAVSVLSALVAALMVGLIAARLVPDSGRWTRLTCGVTAGLVALSFWPVVAWAPLMRVDMIACAFSLGGLYFAMRALQRPLLIHLAAIAFVAAVYSKQTMIAAPAAVFLVLLVLRPRMAAAGISTSLAVGLIPLTALAFATEGGFLRHIFLYNVNRFDVAQLWRLSHAIGMHALYAGFAIYGFLSCWRLLTRMSGDASNWKEVKAQLGANPAAIQLLFALSYLLLASTMLILIGKVGANINYLIEWMLAASVFVGISVRQAAAAAFSPRHEGPVSSLNFLAIVLIPIAVAWQAMVLPRPVHHTAVWSQQDHVELVRIAELIRAADRPVISDDMVLLLRSGKQVVWEPAIFAELASTGFYDEQPFVQMVRNGAFEFFVTTGDRGSEPFDLRYNPAVADAMDEAYPRKREMAGFTLHMPAE
ncbi:ArnT family glycosyltransferase [Phenylobacterium sp.]|uniref:ArnT family glycosyltransferase n=1 Tax=Phenylobacterium sp. TaxID=1871053 RepID=UPI002FCA401B